MDRRERRETRAFKETDEAPRNCAALSLKVMRVTCVPTRPSQQGACYQKPACSLVIVGAPRIISAVALAAA